MGGGAEVEIGTEPSFRHDRGGGVGAWPCKFHVGFKIFPSILHLEDLLNSEEFRVISLQPLSELDSKKQA